MGDFIQDKERIDMGIAVAGYKSQLQDIARQAASISIQISDAKAKIINGTIFTTQDKALITALEKVVTDPAYTAFVTLVQTGVI